MRSRTCPGLGIQPPKKGAFTIETSPDFFKMHMLALFSGKRGGGKSVAVANLIRVCKERGYLDRVILITPTFESNKEIWAICGVTKLGPDVMEPSRGVLAQVTAAIEAEADEWDRFLEEKREWQRVQRDLESGKDLSAVWSEAALLRYHGFGWFDAAAPKRPVWKYKEERPPRLAAVIDDCMGTDLLLPSAGLVNICIKHRHLGRGLGCSVFMLVQSYCAQGGIARPIRENCTLLALFKMRDMNQRAKLLEEADLGLTEAQFAALTDYAWSKPYGFLTVDFSPKQEDMRFRSGFEEILSVPQG
jgi:hypothetical protein